MVRDTIIYDYYCDICGREVDHFVPFRRETVAVLDILVDGSEHLLTKNRQLCPQCHNAIQQFYKELRCGRYPNGYHKEMADTVDRGTDA